jgi:hypothetical protein
VDRNRLASLRSERPLNTALDNCVTSTICSAHWGAPGAASAVERAMARSADSLQITEKTEGRGKGPRRFPKGRSGNPAGRSRRSKSRKALMPELLLHGEAGALVRKAIEPALSSGRRSSSARSGRNRWRRRGRGQSGRGRSRQGRPRCPRRGITPRSRAKPAAACPPCRAGRGYWGPSARTARSNSRCRRCAGSRPRERKPARRTAHLIKPSPMMPVTIR